MSEVVMPQLCATMCSACFLQAPQQLCLKSAWIVGQMFVLCVVLGAALLKVFRVLSFVVFGSRGPVVVLSLGEDGAPGCGGRYL